MFPLPQIGKLRLKLSHKPKSTDDPRPDSSPRLGESFGAVAPAPLGLSPHSLINADFCVASVCVAFGAVLGKVSPVQLLIMTFFQVTLYTINEFILLNKLEVSGAQTRGRGRGDTGEDTEREGWGHMPAWQVA